MRGLNLKKKKDIIKKIENNILLGRLKNDNNEIIKFIKELN